ncbi:MAG: YihY/virulence factor BrkB family protein [Actinobacteria bacterium]|nr:MAG: YihY/virulence factor BrkB family protein [Actinomycetota bacterium]
MAARHRSISKRAGALARRLDAVQERRPWLAFPFAVLRKFGDDRGSSLAALISYYTFFSLFPLLVVLATVTGFFIRGRPDRQAALIHSALAQFPVVGANIEGNVHALNGNLLTLALGIAGCLWAGAAVSDAVRTALDDVWDVPRHHRAPVWRGRIVGLAWLLVFVIGVVGTGTLLSIATSRGVALPGSALVLATAIDIAVVATAFHLLPSDRPPWREVVPGAIVAGILWAALQTAGSWIVTRQIQGASDVYGFFALVIGLLSWVYLTAEAILIGAEANVVLHRRLWPRSLVPPPPTAADLTSSDEQAREGHALAGDRMDAEVH